MRMRLCFPLIAGGILLILSSACSGQQSSPTLQATSAPHVTTRLKAAPLQEALKELSRLTGVRMTCSADTSDLKVTVLVNDLPLDIVQARLAETLHLTWMSQEVKKDTPPSCVLFRSPRNAEEEQELRARGENAFRKGIDEAIGVLPLPPGARYKLFAVRKALEQTFARSNGEAAVTLLSALTPNQRASIMDGNKLEFPSDRPPSELAPHIDAIMKAWIVAMGNDAFARTFDQSNRRFSLERIGAGAGSMIQVTFSVQGEKGSASSGALVRGVVPEEIYPDAYTPDHKSAGYADAHRPIDVPTNLTAESLAALLEKAADTLHLNIIGESYSEYVPKHGKPVAVYPSSVPPGPSTIEQALDRILVRNYWWKQGSVYLFQRPQWWADRRSDVTDATSAYLAQILKRQPLSFEDAAEICKTLNAEQWKWLIPRYIADSRYLTPVQTALRFYGNLSLSRKAELFREGGMDASGLEAADQLRLKTWIAETGKEALLKVQNTPGTIRIMAIRLAQDPKLSPVQFRALFQAKDGTTSLLREQSVRVSDPTETRISSED